MTAALASAAAFALSGCATPVTVSFEDERPWHSGEYSYEMLSYDVNIYDASNGTEADKRVKIASGSLSYTLDETRPEDSAIAYTVLDADFSVTYNDSAPDADKGKTDTIKSTTEFQTDSLVTKKMNKTVSLAARDGKDDLSYTLEADYFGAQKATRVMTATGEKSDLDIPNGSYYDNETMFFLARATVIGKNVTTNFYMTSLFDCFVSNKFEALPMIARGAADSVSVDVGDWVSAFGVAQATADDGTVSYPVSCLNVTVMKNVKKSGPAYTVYYSENAFTQNEKKHAKIPVKIEYSEYSGSKVKRVTEYTLNGCSFERPQSA